ncbi:hypothetical protein [Bacillus sp. JJ1562]|uniref:hypothetical protein n=1 Tax=Bacillus sp. JJ1562 TaxID=3122960 RepID=UPI0030013BA0
MKWKNYGLWVSLASILYMVFKDLGMQIDLTTWETYVTAIIGLLATLGIISNPDKGKGFFDKIPNTPAEAITQVAEQLQNQNESPTSQQGMPPQNQNPSNVQQYQGNLQQQTNVNQLPPDGSSPANFEQNEYPNHQTQPNNIQNEYQEYQAQPNDFQQNDTNQNVDPNSQEVEPQQVQPEANAQIDEFAEAPDQEKTPDNNSFDKSSIHGMPAPPNEHL